MTITKDDVKRARSEAQWRDMTATDKRGQIGRIVNGQRLVWDTQRPGHVWVTLHDGGSATSVGSYFCKVSPTFGSWVIIGRDRDGVEKVIDTDDQANKEAFGARATTLIVPPGDPGLRGGGWYDLVREDRFDVLRLKPTTPASMRLRYRGGAVHYSGVTYWIPPGLTEDLTARLPTTGKRIVAVGLDMPSGVLVYANGAEVPATGVPLGEAELVSIPLSGSGSVIPIGGVILSAGQSTIDRDIASNLIHVHPWLSVTGVSTSSGGGTGDWSVDEPPAAPTSYDDEFDDESIAVAWTETDPGGDLTIVEADDQLGITAAAGISEGTFLRDAPTGDFQFVAKLASNIFSDSYPTTGFSWAGICITFDGETDPYYVTLNRVRGSYTDNKRVSYVGGLSGYLATITPTDYYYLRIRYDATSTEIAFEFSYDGETWETTSQTVSDYLTTPTVDQIGFYINHNASGYALTADYEYERVRETFGESTDPVYGQGDLPLTGAASISYAPADAADWTDPDPDDVAEALDKLAARVVGVPLTVQEADGAPTVANVDTIVVTNGTLTDDGSGQVTLDLSAASDADAIHDNVSGEIAALTEKASPVSGDLIIIEDSEASNVKKKVQIGNLSSGASIYPKRATMWHHESLVVTGNAITNDASVAAQFFNVRSFQSPAANGDVFTNACALAAGTYTFYVLGITSPAHGIIDWAVKEQGSGSFVDFITGQDWYANPGANNAVKSGTLTITTPGWHIIRGTVNGKNAGSSDYYMVLTKMWVAPSAD